MTDRRLRTLTRRLRPDRVTARVLALAGALAVLGTVLAYATFLRSQKQHFDISVPVGWIVAGFIITAAAPLVLEVGSNSLSLSLSEIPLVIALLTTQRLPIILAGTFGSLIARMLDRRMALVKVAFNVPLTYFELCVTAAVFDSIEADPHPDSWTTWAALMVALSVSIVLSTTAVNLVIVLTGDRMPLRQALHHSLLGVTNAAIAVGIGVVTVLVGDRTPLALVLVLALGLVSILPTRRNALLQRRYENLALMHEYAAALSRSSDLQTTLSNVLTETARTLRAEGALILLANPGPAPESLRHGKIPSGFPALADQPWRDAIVAGRSYLIRAGAEEHRAFLARSGVKDVMAAPLAHGAELLGTLIVLNRQGDVSSFDADDLAILSTLAIQTTVTLENLRLIDSLHNESAIREYQAGHDRLTGLLNRASLERELDAAIVDATERHLSFALLLVDLNRFKEINDALGLEAGDDVLRAVAARLRTAVPSNAAVARLSGDEFAVVLRAVPGIDAAVDRADHVQQIFADAFAIGALSLHVNASIGVACYPEHGQDGSTLLRRADLAMYAAKSARGGAVRAYDPSQEHTSARQLTMTDALRGAIADGTLAVHFQPKATMRTGQIRGVEALVRWNDARFGTVGPDEFIPLAEHAGLTRSLTELVLRRSLAQVAQWRAVGLDIAVAVNVDPPTLCEPEFPETVISMLAEHAVSPSSLTFEITERQFVAEFAIARRAIDVLRGHGVRLSIDDFGTGSTSLSYLTHLDFDEIKIDRSFVEPLVRSPRHAAVVHAVLDLATNLGLDVVAEGIEDEPTWQRLDEMGCLYAQGYLLRRPEAGPALTAWLLDRQAARETEVADPGVEGSPSRPAGSRR